MSYNRKRPATIIRVDGEICNGRHSDVVNGKDVWYGGGVIVRQEG